MAKVDRKYRFYELESCPGTFEIRSWSTGGKHFVDIWAYEGNGSCGCKDFNTRCLPNWKKNGHQVVDYGTTARPSPKRTHCKHLKLIKWKWCNKICAEMYRQHRLK
jgi:hypothetical protein